MHEHAQRLHDIYKPDPKQLHKLAGADIMFGTVRSLSPLQIQLDNRLIPPEDCILTSPLCQITSTWKAVSFTENQNHSHYIPETETGSAKNHTHFVALTPVKSSGGGLTHTHDYNNFTTSDVNGHCHEVVVTGKSGAATPFDFWKGSPLNALPDRWYENSYAQCWHYHTIDGSFVVQPYGEGDDAHTHDLSIMGQSLELLLPGTLWRNIRVGDTVNMIMQSDKQKYYVIQRQGMGVLED